MNRRLIGAGGEEIGNVSSAGMALRKMSPEQFRALGLNQVVYMRVGLLDGDPFFLIHGADGVPLATVEDLEEAVEIAAEQGFEFITVH